MTSFDRDGLFLGPLKDSYDLFTELGCIINAPDQKDLLMTLDEDKMRCLILDCLVALRQVQKQKRIEKINYRYECTKNRIFVSAVSIIIDDKVSVESDQHILISLLASFPDRKKMTDGRNWLPLHFAVALGDRVSEDDFHKLYSAEPLALRQYSLENVYFCGTVDEERHDDGFTPGHLLCMRKHPNISLIKYLSMRDLQAFSMIIKDFGSNALQLAAQYSENTEVLRILLQIDHSMTRRFNFRYVLQ
jgi:hypothetical protein